MLSGNGLKKIGFIFSGVAFLYYLSYRVALLFFPTQDAGGVEGNIIYFIQRLLNGEPLYSDPEWPPYAIAQYSPAYYYIVAGISKVSGLAPDDLLQLYAVNRATGLFFNLILLVIIYRICRKIFLTGKLTGATVTAACFILLDITSYARPDSLYHCFFLASVYYFLRYIKAERERARSFHFFIVSIVLSGFTLFVKQTAIVIPVVLCAGLLVEKKYKVLVRYVLGYLVTTLALLAILYGFSDLANVYKNVVLGVDNGISPGWFRHAVFQAYYLKHGLLFLLLAATVFILTRGKSAVLIRYIRTMLVLLFLLLNIIMLKNGSNPGYLTEWWILLLCLSAYCFEYLSAKGQTKATGMAMIFFAGIILVKIVMDRDRTSGVFSKGKYEAALAHYQKQYNFAQKVKDRMGASDQYVLFLNIYTPDSYLENLFYKNAVLPQMDIAVLASYPQKKFDYTDFKKSFYDGTIKWMITDTARKDINFFDLDLGRFRLADSGAGFNLYRNNP